MLLRESSLADLEARAVLLEGGADAAPWPEDWRIVNDRPSRTVVRAMLEGPTGPVACFVKFRRRVGVFDAMKDRIRTPRGPAEARVLDVLAARGVDVPRVAACSAGQPGVDLLVTAEVPGRDLESFLAAGPSHADRARAARAVGRLLKAAHRAGWDGRDLHRGNVMIDGDRAVLLDPGTRPPGKPLSRRATERALGRALHGLSSSPKDALRALSGYLGDVAGDRRALATAADRSARRIARRYRRGRSRRATRTGRHFVTFSIDGVEGVRRRDGTEPQALATFAAWLAGSEPELRRPLKSDGHVFVAEGAGLPGSVVVKRFDAKRRDRFRTPRAIRAFRRAYALRIRGVACPKPIAAAASTDGAGLYVAELARDGDRVAADLYRLVRPSDDGPSAYSRLSPAARAEALHALGRFVRRIHDAEVSHRDLKAPNIVARRDASSVSYEIVDLEGARIRRGEISWRRRARDLARLDASFGRELVSRADRLRVVRGYFAPWRRPPVDLRTFTRRVASASLRKRGPTGRPR